MCRRTPRLHGLLFLGLVLTGLLVAQAAGSPDSYYIPPGDLLAQADSVLLLEFGKPDEKGVVRAAVGKVLKGPANRKEVVIDLMAGPFEAQSKAVAAAIAKGQKQAVMFIGTIGDEPGGGGPQEIAFVHMAGPDSAQWQWIRLVRGPNGKWEMAEHAPQLQATWSGGTDMLLRLLEKVLEDPEVDTPVDVGVQWDVHVRAGVVDRAHGMEPVDLAGKGACDLFVAADKGDRLFRMDGNAFRDITASVKLGSRSRAFAWADLDGDGRLDLASWDGKALVLWMQQADGVFRARPADIGEALKDGCLGLAALDVGAKGRAGLLAGTARAPVLLTPLGDGRLRAAPLFTGEAPAKDLGPPGRCLVGDLDGDGQADVLQLFAAGSLLYRGREPGRFHPPVATAAAAGKGRSDACLGDFDGDGKLEVVAVAEDAARLWQNLGGGQFAERLSLSGEVAWMTKPGGIAVRTGDVNGDGRQDLLIAYGARVGPQVFYGRGFRSFGHAHQLGLEELKLLPEALEGQQAGCLGDFNGDGALDMAVVLANGEAWVFPRKVEAPGALAAVVSLSAGGPHAGPVSVTASRGKLVLGTYSVRAGGPPAIIGAREAGPVDLTWRWPGGEALRRRVVLTGVTRVVLDKP